MNAIIKPIALGVAAYLIAAVGFWFILSFLLLPLASSVFWLLPAAITLVPLFLSGYVAARYTVSSHPMRKIAIGMIAGIIGTVLTLAITQARGEIWFFALYIFCAASVSAVGGFVSTRPSNSL